MKERLKELRKELGLTQAEFGEMIGVKGNTITGYETGIRGFSNLMITSICRAFNVNETWFRDGTGPMFAEKSRDEELAEFFGTVTGLDDCFKKRFLRILAELPEEWWEVLEQAVLREAEKNKTPDEPAP